MNSTKLASRLLFMAAQLTGEAQRQPRGCKVRTELNRGALQLAYAHRAAWSTDPDFVSQAEALVDGAIDYLVIVITARTERELEQGEAP